MGLSITIANNPLDPGAYIGREIEIDEWDALFLRDLGIPEPTREPNEQRDDYLERWKSTYTEIMKQKGFPLVGRIWHYNCDVYFEIAEIVELRKECNDLMGRVHSGLGKSALAKLDLACQKAMRSGSGIFLGGD